MNTILDAFKRELVNLYNAVLAGFPAEPCFRALDGNRTAALGLEVDLYVTRNTAGDYELSETEPAEPHATLSVSWGCWFDGVAQRVDALTEDEVAENASNYVDAGADVLEQEIERQLTAAGS